MTNVKVVPGAAPDPKAGKERQVSGYFVPYYALADAIDVARAVHDAGGRVNREQLAGFLKHKSTNSGAFLTRVSGAKAFGLVDQPDTNSDNITLTRRGTAIVAPVSDAEATQAKVEAFMAIALFKLIYDEYRGRELPQDVGLANLFENTHKMLKSRAMPAVKVMMTSAETAGLFKINGVASRKMVMPVMPSGSTHTPDESRKQNPLREEQHRNGGSGNGGNGGGTPPTDIDPAFIALLTRLPAAGTTLTAARRENLIAAFKATVEWLYPSPDVD